MSSKEDRDDRDMDWQCPNCGGQGEITHKYAERPVGVVCQNCSFVDAYLWCENCGMGGQIADTDFNERPFEWECSDCHRKYDLPAGFYFRLIEFEPQAFSPPSTLPPLQKRYLHISNSYLRKLVTFWESWRFHISLAVIVTFGVLVASLCVDETTSLDMGSLRRLALQLLLFSLGGIPIVMLFDGLTWIITRFYDLKFARETKKRTLQDD